MRSGELGGCVPPYAAAWLLRQVPLERFTEQAGVARSMRRPEIAGDLEFARDQLRAARRVYVRSLEAVASACGNSETALAAAGAGSVGMDVMDTGQAAARLACTPRRVRQHLASGALRGAKRGGAWAVDSASVEDLLSLRRLA